MKLPCGHGDFWESACCVCMEQARALLEGWSSWWNSEGKNPDIIDRTRAFLARQAPEPARESPCCGWIPNSITAVHSRDCKRAPPEPPAPRAIKTCPECTMGVSVKYEHRLQHRPGCSRAPTPPACPACSDPYGARVLREGHTCPAAGRGGGR